MTYENFGNSGNPQVEAAGDGVYEDAYQRASYKATYGGDVSTTWSQGQQPQTQSGGQWRATYGRDAGQAFRAGVQNENSGGDWRATYGRDAGQNFRAGVQNENAGGDWRALYGRDAGQNFRPGVASENSGDWRAVYGRDAGQNFRPGTQNDGSGYVDNNGQWRPNYGSDVSTTYRPGVQNDGTGYVDNNGQWRPDYGSDVATTFNPGTNGDIEPWRYYYDDTLRTAQNDGSYQPELDQYADQYGQLDDYRQTDRYAQLDPMQYDQLDRFDRAAYNQNGRQSLQYDRNGRPSNYGDDYSYNFDPRQQYVQQMMLRQILGMIHNQGGHVNVFRGGGNNQGYDRGYQGYDRGYQGGHRHQHYHRQQNNGPRLQLSLNF